MAPRPAILEEPDFDLRDLSLTSYWKHATGSHGLSESDVITRALHGHFNFYYWQFLHSEHDISDEGEEWTPQQVIGQGGFGLVGVWTKANSHGKTVDEMVIKELFGEYHKSQDVTYRVQREACIHRDAQRQAHELVRIQKNDHSLLPSGEHPILHMRNYKYNQHCRSCRYYTIRAPHGSLNDLIVRYRIWDSFLPELFVWHLAYSLAKAVVALDQPIHPSSEFRKIEDPDYVDNCYILHMDIKPENIFLDYAPKEDAEIDAMYNTVPNGTYDPILTYPTPKLADFGLSIYESPEDVVHQRMSGTERFYPPEQSGFGNWFSPENRPCKPEVPWTAAANVYGIGHVLFDVITMLPESWLNEELMQLRSGKAKYSEKRYLDNNHHFLSERVPENTCYSHRLWRLVRVCLSPRPTDRLSPNQLVAEARMGLNWARKQVNNLNDQSSNDIEHPPAYKVFYRGNEIESMALGNAKMELLATDFNVVKGQDTRGSPLKLPSRRMRDFLRQKSVAILSEKGRILSRRPNFASPSTIGLAPGNINETIRYSQNRFYTGKQRDRDFMRKLRKQRRTIKQLEAQHSMQTQPPAQQLDQQPQRPNHQQMQQGLPQARTGPPYPPHLDAAQNQFGHANPFQQTPFGHVPHPKYAKKLRQPPPHPFQQAQIKYDDFFVPTIPVGRGAGPKTGRTNPASTAGPRISKARKAVGGERVSEDKQDKGKGVAQRAPWLAVEQPIHQQRTPVAFPPQSHPHPPPQVPPQPPLRFSPSSQPQLPLQLPQQPQSQTSPQPAPQSLPQAPPPTAAEYDAMTVTQMKIELMHRQMQLPKPPQGKKHVRKSAYNQQLQEADRQGKRGRGVYRG